MVAPSKGMTTAVGLPTQEEGVHGIRWLGNHRGNPSCSRIKPRYQLTAKFCQTLQSKHNKNQRQRMLRKIPQRFWGSVKRHTVKVHPWTRH